jgi:hypothetical protein
LAKPPALGKEVNSGSDGTASTGDVEKERHQKMAEVLPPYAAHNTEI